MISRRTLLHSGTGLLALPMAGCLLSNQTNVSNALYSSNVNNIVITNFELIPVRVAPNTLWLFLRLHTNAGLTGLGEASNALTKDAASVESLQVELTEFFTLITNRSPFDIEHFRQQGRSRALNGLLSASAYSAIEQAMWDLSGHALEVPSYQLFGGKVRDSLPVYANINRAANPRNAEGFVAVATRAYNDGFRAMKSAPFDNFPVNGTATEIAFHIDRGIEIAFAIREAVGGDVELMLDGHSFFSIEQAINIAERLEPVNLTWYEEPVAPSLVDATLSIKNNIRQPMAGGELFFGLEGFKEIIQRQAFDVIMPDIKHCGGIKEMIHIAAMAAEEGIMVAPHNPSGPVSTAASIQVSAGLPNFNFMELQYGQVPWRSNVLQPTEVFVEGMVKVPDSPGFGIELNEDVIKENSLPV
ncbi:MAG: mandelate racemase/muconate lactonizing enzyme family protein [Gammaproteobacteria bacterium]|nr:mandelate racemase/muconate lactonizing enzyme family protein [Gammaproteobacteria bacterium]